MSNRKSTLHAQVRCSFCGRPASKVSNMIKGGPVDGALKEVYICDICVSSAMQIIKHNNFSTTGLSTKNVRNRASLTPVMIKKFLDEYVIGQDRAKKALAVAVYNHYKRIEIQKQPRSRNDVELTKSDRKSTRLNSSHSQISYAVFCLKKKRKFTEHHHCARG